MIELALSEPRLKRTDLKIYDGTKISDLESLSPLGKALKTRKTSDWFLMVSADQKYSNEVKKVAENVLKEIVFH